MVKPAEWKDRFWAWLIDILLISLAWYWVVFIRGQEIFSNTSLGSLAALTFVYWTALEGYRGQSLGKMVMNLLVVNKYGGKIGFQAAAVESFGKAFLLPLDCLLGWTAWRGSGQRLFNRMSDTTVTYMDEEMSRCSI